MDVSTGSAGSKGISGGNSLGGDMVVGLGMGTLCLPGSQYS